MSRIQILTESYVDVGNSGIHITIYQQQAPEITIIGDGIFKSAASDYSLRGRNTNVMYMSGIVVEGGGLVVVGADGDISAEFNGKLLTENATILIPEIFKSDAEIPDEEPEDPDDLQDPSVDGKPTTGTVVILSAADQDPFTDRSVQSYPVTNDGVVLQTQRKKFGTGSADFGIDYSVATCLKWGPVISPLVNLEDTSFTVEFYIRFDTVDNRTMRLFDVGDVFGNSAYYLDYTFDEAGTDTLVFHWYDIDRNEREITMPLTERPFVAKQWQAFTYVYNSQRGQFAFWVDGNRVGFVDASVFVDPEWSGLNTLPVTDPRYGQDIYIGQGGHVGPLQPGGSPTGNNNFTGLLDNWRFTHNQALYDSRGRTLTLYPWPWPAPRTNPVPPPEPDPEP